jgi:hypothetical protein
VILSAADYAEDERKTPPRELLCAFDWLYRYLPPRSGGSLDQPYALMLRMRVAYNVYTAMTAWHEARSMVDFVHHQPGRWKIVQEVLKLRKARDGGANKS